MPKPLGMCGMNTLSASALHCLNKASKKSERKLIYDLISSYSNIWVTQWVPIPINALHGLILATSTAVCLVNSLQDFIAQCDVSTLQDPALHALLNMSNTCCAVGP